MKKMMYALVYIYIYTFIYIPLNIHVGWVEIRIENGQAPTHSRGLGYNLSRAIEIYGSDNDQTKCHDKPLFDTPMWLSILNKYSGVSRFRIRFRVTY